MRRIALFILCFAFQFSFGQDTYTIAGEELPLKVEVEGELDLLWNNFNNNYRFFVRTSSGEITELKATIREDGQIDEDFKTTLYALTNGLSTSRLKLRLNSLREYLHKYNASLDPDYKAKSRTGKALVRFGLSGGITNNPFITNPENVKVPLIGAELEISEGMVRPRHSGFLQARHAFETDELKYNTTELSIGYRYRIINASAFSFYAQVKLATLNYFQTEVVDDLDPTFTEELSDVSFDAPFIFGVGSDIKVGKNGFITIIYGELFGVLIENQGNFSNDISIGYKFNL